MKKAAKNETLPTAAHSRHNGGEISDLQSAIIKDRAKTAIDCPFAGSNRCTGACGKHH